MRQTGYSSVVRHNCTATNPGAPYPRFPVELSGFRELQTPFLKERRTRSPCERRVQEIRGISLVFREMWRATVGRPFTTGTDISRRAVVRRAVVFRARM